MQQKIIMLLLTLCLLPAYATEKHVLIKVKEMTCQLCVYTINQALREVDGVLTTKGNLAEQTVLVKAEYQVDEQTMLQAIEALSYHAEIVQKR